MSRKVTVEDGQSSYTLTRTDGGAKLDIKGELTAKLAKDLIEDLKPIALARAPKPRAPKLAKPEAPKPAPPEGGS